MSSVGLMVAFAAAFSAEAAPVGHAVVWGDTASPVVKLFPDSLAAPRWIRACGDRSLAYRSHGRIAWWGSRSLDARYSPAGWMGLRSLACSEDLTFGLTDSGTVVHWGPPPAMGNPTPPVGLKGVVEISAGLFHAVALRQGGDVVAWGSDLDSAVTKSHGRGGIRSVSAGGTQVVLLRTDSTVEVAGGKLTGVSQVPSGLRGVVAVASGGRHALALKADGRVVAWGDAAQPQWEVPAGLDSVVAIAAGGYHSLALRRDGRVVCWGQDTKGQCKVPEEAREVVAIAAGSDHSLALRRDGLVVAWGSDAQGQCAVPFKVKAVESIHMGRNAAAAILPDGSMAAWGSLPPGPVPVLPAGRRWSSVSFGSTPHALAIDDRGTPYAWGSSTLGVSTLPVGLGSASQVEATRAVSLVLDPQGRLHAWGEDNDGLVTGAAQQDSVVQFDAGEYRVVALRSDSSVRTWGKMVYPTLDTVPSATRGAVAVAAGDQAFFALMRGGTVFAWNPRPALEARHLPPVGLDSVVQVAAGSVHALALRADGRVVCWGDSTRRRCDVPDGLGKVSRILAGETASLALVSVDPVDRPVPVGMASSIPHASSLLRAETTGLHASGERAVTVSVFAPSGRPVLLSRRLEPGQRLGGDWPSGIYLVRVQDEGRTIRWVLTGR